MKRAGGSCAVADTRRADRSGDAFETMGQQRPVHDRDHCAQVTDHREQPLFGPAPVDVAVTRAHRTQQRSQISPHRIQDGLPKRQPSRAVPNERREDIALAQGQPHRHAQGLLAAAQENAAVDLAHAIEARELVVQDARHQHQPVRLHVRITKRGNPVNRIVVEQSVNHGRQSSRRNAPFAIVSLRVLKVGEYVLFQGRTAGYPVRVAEPNQPARALA